MGEWARGCEHSGAQSQNQSGSTSQHGKTQKRERERERKQVVISHPCSMQRKYNFHLGSTTKNQKRSETESSRLNSLNGDVIINGSCSVINSKGDAADVTLNGAFQRGGVAVQWSIDGGCISCSPQFHLVLLHVNTITVNSRRAVAQLIWL